jgi:hypothetical protein
MEMGKFIFYKTHFINSFLKPFIHGCFSVCHFYISILPFFHTSKVVWEWMYRAVSSRPLFERTFDSEMCIGVNKLLNEKFLRVGFRLYICPPNKNG